MLRPHFHKNSRIHLQITHWLAIICIKKIYATACVTPHKVYKSLHFVGHNVCMLLLSFSSHIVRTTRPKDKMCRMQEMLLLEFHEMCVQKDEKTKTKITITMKISFAFAVAFALRYCRCEMLLWFRIQSAGSSFAMTQHKFYTLLHRWNAEILLYTHIIKIQNNINHFISGNAINNRKLNVMKWKFIIKLTYELKILLQLCCSQVSSINLLLILHYNKLKKEK